MSESSHESSQELRVSTQRRYWRRDTGPIKWWPWGLLPLIGLLLLYLWGAFVTAPNIEEQVQETVTENLAAKGFAAAGVAAAGQTIDVHVASSAGELAHAEAVARSTRCSTWAGRLICPTDVDLDAQTVAEVVDEPAPAVASTLSPRESGRLHNFRVDVDATGARLEGEVPSEDARALMVTQAQSRFDRVEDLLTVTGEAATDEFPLAAQRAVVVTSSFERGYATWQGGSFSAQGLVQAETEGLARNQFNDASQAPTLGSLSLEVIKATGTCNEEFAQALSADTINFTTASASIDASSQTLLESLAQIANQCSGVLGIEGHTDSVGNAEYNMSLSQERAASVKVALSQLGVADDRLSAVGYGETQPIASNDNETGRAQNRRIVIQIATEN